MNSALGLNAAPMRASGPTIGYRTSRGQMLQTSIEEFLASDVAARLKGKVQLILTSPPFPLNRKKKYGNLVGEDYIDWLSGLAPRLARLLKPDGSLVIEVGNSWERGSPTMSTLALRALLRFLDVGKLRLCQQFVAYNPARLPSPIQWVNKERIRVKDAYTHVWWMSPTDRPLADNRRVLKEYSPAMKRLLRTKKYNSGRRPSEYVIGAESFLADNGGAIPPNVLEVANTHTNDEYHSYCVKHGLAPHPARMQPEIPEFFIRFLTKPRHLVLDPFAGANTTGVVAESLKRRWISVEPVRDYVLGSRARFPQETLIDL